VGRGSEDGAAVGREDVTAGHVAAVDGAVHGAGGAADASGGGAVGGGADGGCTSTQCGAGAWVMEDGCVGGCVRPSEERVRVAGRH